MAKLIASLPFDITQLLGRFSDEGEDGDPVNGVIRVDYPDGSAQYYSFSPVPLTSSSLLIGFAQYAPGDVPAFEIEQMSVSIRAYGAFSDAGDATGLTAYIFRGNDEFYGVVGADDVLFGFAGNDTFFHADEHDVLIGGAGVDTIGFRLAVNLEDAFFAYKTEIESVVLEQDAAGQSIVLGANSQVAGINSVSAQKLLSPSSSVAFDASERVLAITLVGSAGNDTLIGGSGIDSLRGGAGDDTYYVGSGDVITELAGAGGDQVFSTGTLTLAPNVENLTLAAGIANINATGNTGINTLTGNSGNNILDGGAGADTMIGGEGDDTYVVDNALDSIVEAADGGSDTLQTSFGSTVTLVGRANIENITLTGSAIAATGNVFANKLTGNAVGNTLDGGLGADAMLGGLGNDTYFVDNIGDVVTEGVNAGADLVRSTVELRAVGQR